jgi:hypothetical protein
MLVPEGLSSDGSAGIGTESLDLAERVVKDTVPKALRDLRTRGVG